MLQSHLRRRRGAGESKGGEGVLARHIVQGLREMRLLWVRDLPFRRLRLPDLRRFLPEFRVGDHPYPNTIRIPFM